MIELQCGCKLNLGLKIGPKLASGYHELESLFAPLKYPRDRIRIEKEGFGLAISANVPIPGKNILRKTYEAFEQATGFAPGLKLRLIKTIPMGAGLGGGSANAGIFLRWLNAEAGRPLDMENLAALARGLGSDVPFFLYNSPCLVAGSGEKIQPARLSSQTVFVVLVWPQTEVSTAWAFGALDRLRQEKDGTGRPENDEKCLTIGQGGNKKSFSRGVEFSVLDMRLHNDLEEPVFEKYPHLRAIKNSFLEAGACRASMSGSGSAIFGLFGDIKSAQDSARIFRRQYKHVFLNTVC